MPAALHFLAGKLDVAKHFHGFALGEAFSSALPFEVHAMAARAFKDKSVGFVHKPF